MGVIGAVSSYMHKDKLAIYVTSLVGSYSFIRGLSLLIGGFPNELALHNEMMHKGTVKFTPAIIGYVVGIIVLFILGVFYQEMKKRDKLSFFKRV